MRSIEELQALYKAVHGVEAGDIHRLRASFEFNIPYLDVTREQRLQAKAINYGAVYGFNFMFAEKNAVSRFIGSRTYKPRTGPVCYK